MRRVAVEYFAHGVQAAFIKVSRDSREQRPGVRRIAVNPVVSQGKRTEEPAPHGSLVVASVPLLWTADVLSGIARVAPCKTSQAYWREQFARADVDDGSRAPLVE